MQLTELGKELRKLRVDLDINLADMAGTVGVSSAFLSAVETGKKPAPSDFVDRLANHYSAIADNQAAYQRLAEKTRYGGLLKLDIRNASPEIRELAILFSRKFHGLSCEQIKLIGEVLEN